MKNRRLPIFFLAIVIVASLLLWRIISTGQLSSNARDKFESDIPVWFGDKKAFVRQSFGGLELRSVENLESNYDSFPPIGLHFEYDQNDLVVSIRASFYVKEEPFSGKLFGCKLGEPATVCSEHLIATGWKNNYSRGSKIGFGLEDYIVTLEVLTDDAHRGATLMDWNSGPLVKKGSLWSIQGARR